MVGEEGKEGNGYQDRYLTIIYKCEPEIKFKCEQCIIHSAFKR